MAQINGPEFDVQTTYIDGIPVLAVRGDVDQFTAPLLTDAVRESLIQVPRALVIDLTEVDFLGSAGMSVLVVAQEKAGQSTHLAVVAHGPKTRRPLEMVGLYSLLNLHTTLDEALTGFRPT